MKILVRNALSIANKQRKAARLKLEKARQELDCVKAKLAAIDNVFYVNAYVIPDQPDLIKTQVMITREVLRSVREPAKFISLVATNLANQLIKIRS